MDPADAWVSTDWNVASGLFRWKITVWSSGVSIAFGSTERLPSGLAFATLASRIDAPSGSAIAMFRSTLNFTSDDVSGLPLEKVSPSRSVHWNVDGSVYSHDSAASPSGLVVPGGTVSSCWYIAYCRVDEPRS